MSLAEKMIFLLENPFQAFVALGTPVVSLLVVGWHWGRHESEDWVMDKAGDLVHGLRKRLQEMIGEIVQKY